ncbi:agamous-like MADS-box protein AGL80 [Magnolia sinica]|uniref:agamous-like MADS-box protein AGL80 n=1 Tax=Magnolia sinica TaxID=86752 RepID=UPI0026584BB8|nr:agamous-like MADS-box protein AGL80 [Magnolia sinica]
MPSNRPFQYLLTQYLTSSYLNSPMHFLSIKLRREKHPTRPTRPKAHFLFLDHLAMARKKVKLAWIANDSSRKATFKKRKKGLIKKVRELSTLCGVPACAIIYGPQSSQPLEVWPTSADAVDVIMRFKSLPEMEQSKKMINQEGFLRQRLAKLKEQLKRQEKENREAEARVLMYESLAGKGLHGACMEDLNKLRWLVESKIKSVQERIEVLRRSAVPVKIQAKEESMKREEDVEKLQAFEVVAMEMEALQRQQWFMEVMNSHEPVGYVGGELMGPFGDSNPWLDACFP